MALPAAEAAALVTPRARLAASAPSRWNQPRAFAPRIPRDFSLRPGSCGRLTRLSRGLGSGRENLPLHIFRLQQMAALVGHHPRECGGQAHAERSLADFD